MRIIAQTSKARSSPVGSGLLIQKQLPGTRFQQRNHLLTQLGPEGRRLLLLLVCRLLAMLLSLGLGGCGLAPGQPTAEDLLYLGWDDAGREQLFLSKPDKETQLLTSFDAGVQGYAPSPDGRHIALSTMGENSSSELWIMAEDGSSQKQLHSCLQAECSSLAWAPDSRRLLFERREIGGDGMAGAPTLWWLDTQTAEVRTVHEDQSRHGTFGRLSPDGQWLSYHSPEQEGLAIYNLEDGRSHFITNEIGTAAAWSPDGRQLVVPLLDLVISHGDEGDDHQAHEHDYQTAVHLLRLDVDSGEQQTISGDIQGEDSVPAWSPDGQYIAFGRRALGTGASRQLWIMRADGSEARALADDPTINHGPPAWSADSRYLLFQQIPQDHLSSDPQIWRIEIETGVKEQLASSGMQPAWLMPTG